jgi:hypothetical protein
MLKAIMMLGAVLCLFTIPTVPAAAQSKAELVCAERFGTAGRSYGACVRKREKKGRENKAFGKAKNR